MIILKPEATTRSRKQQFINTLKGVSDNFYQKLHSTFMAAGFFAQTSFDVDDGSIHSRLVSGTRFYLKPSGHTGGDFGCAL